MFVLLFMLGLLHVCTGSTVLVKFGYKLEKVLKDARPLYDGEFTKKYCDNHCCKTIFKDKCDDNTGFPIKDTFKTFILQEDKIVECSKQLFHNECYGVSSYDNEGYTTTYSLEKSSADDVIILEMHYYHGKTDTCRACKKRNGKMTINEDDHEKCRIFHDWYLVINHDHLLPCPNDFPSRGPTFQPMTDNPTPAPSKLIAEPTEIPIVETFSPSKQGMEDPTAEPPEQTPTFDLGCRISNDFPCAPV
jgi:hypothetical protein